MIPARTHPIPGWQVVGSVKRATNADTYRVADDQGNRAFLKVFHPDRVPEHRIGAGGKLLEVTILESLHHPRIPSVIESGVLEEGECPYLLTELIPGETLDHRLQREFALRTAPAKHPARATYCALSPTCTGLTIQSSTTSWSPRTLSWTAATNGPSSSTSVTRDGSVTANLRTRQPSIPTTSPTSATKMACPHPQAMSSPSGAIYFRTLVRDASLGPAHDRIRPR